MVELALSLWVGLSIKFRHGFITLKYAYSYMSTVTRFGTLAYFWSRCSKMAETFLGYELMQFMQKKLFKKNMLRPQLRDGTHIILHKKIIEVLYNIISPNISSKAVRR
jgi:hypothetical protein